MRPLAIAAAGGAEHGLGHVLRAASLAREAVARGVAVSFHVAGDERVRETAACEVPETPIHPWDGVSDIASGARGLVIDAPHAIGELLAAAQDSDIPAMVLDRTDQIDAARWTVLPVLHAEPQTDSRVRQGADWCVIEPWNLGLRAPAYPGTRDLLLVLFGGADTDGHSLRVAEALTAGPETGLKPVFVVGPAAPAARARELAGYGEVLHAPSRHELYGWMGRARLGICAFGVSLYELAALGTPALFFTRSEEDVDAALRLAMHGIGRFLGNAADFDAAAVLDALDDALRGEWLAYTHARGLRALGDGGGSKRILELALTGTTQ
ncbi:MAG: hypothetical protein GY723_08985 [bacterium]|nr:hypothetical protein [bacterium]MCP5068567.1 hypothetical protein [bacterium]